MRDLGGTDRMVYMTHSWLMSFFLNCPCSDLTPGQAESPTCTALGLNTPSDFPGAALPDTYVVQKTTGRFFLHAMKIDHFTSQFSLFV